ncbi:MAG: hypothetical protein RR688_13625 [Carnobacterium sp.]|uniref:hypothetical protein n=1 Tax=Carnobacterium sp. TaxID=48221 RepID=UPI002FC62A50
MEEIKNLIRQNPDKFKKNPLLSIVATMCGEEQKIQNTEENWYVVFKETIKLVAITTVEGVEHYFNQLNPTIAYLLINYIKILEFSDLELFMEHGIKLVDPENPTKYTNEQKEQDYQEMRDWLLENSRLTNELSLTLVIRYHALLNQLLIED